MELFGPSAESLLCTILCLLQHAVAYKCKVATNMGEVAGERVAVDTDRERKFVDVYYGIPFAKPPLGDLRFRHPQPADRWRGVLNATKKPNACMQGYDMTFANFSGANAWNPNTKPDEDCLYLNIWVPVRNNRRTTWCKYKKDRAVFVWIYGGGFYSGSAVLDYYDGKYLSAESDIIVVSMQYRVGALGFLSLGIPDAPGNAGMFDQLLALSWVQNHIHNFGGHARNVTIVGESAGSVSVGLHLLSPLSRGKFARAILQSGAPQSAWATYDEEEALVRATGLAKNMKCTTGSKVAMLECMKNKSASVFADPNVMWVVEGPVQFPFLPTVDGTFLTQTPRAALEDGNFKHIPILLGSNANEGSYFLLYANPDYFNLERTSRITSRLFQALLENSFTFYPHYPHRINDFGLEAISQQYTYWHNMEDSEMNILHLDKAVGDFNFVCGVQELADTYAYAGAPVYNYVFTHRASVHHWPRWMGVLHADEIPFIFGEPLIPSRGFPESEKRLSRKMMEYWSNFAKTGNPNTATPRSKDRGDWPMYSPLSKKYLTLNVQYLSGEDKKQAIGSGYRTNECAFWKYYLPALVTKTADISDMERDWKQQFHDWNTKYIVDWKHQFNTFMRTYDKRQDCDRR